MSQQIEATALSATFDAAIAQDAQLDFDIKVPVAIGAVGGTTRCRIKSLVIVSEEDLAWELWLWSKAARAGASYDVDAWLGRWSFLATDAVHSGSDARYRFLIPDLDIAYRDDDALGKLHCSLIPRGAAHVIHKKVIVKVFCEPEIAWAG